MGIYWVTTPPCRGKSQPESPNHHNHKNNNHNNHSQNHQTTHESSSIFCPLARFSRRAAALDAFSTVPEGFSRPRWSPREGLKNGGFQQESPFPGVHFQELCMLIYPEPKCLDVPLEVLEKG